MRDLVIRGGKVVDGTGADPRSADIAIDNGRHLVQRADGYVATVVSGEVTVQDGQDTGARPGRLVRGAR
ncbi:hypothetical protein FAIPA1_540014 [Frankia sp. AiPs1]|uniref:hypothetical protein n=1 Tax=Frankia sp. AiPa1 TaxID=573492 RepID=UPI00202B5B70|nr:hypothetical protein [Frankia sp. AiPa1]MCL9761029.1 hypothetical protein [Frankia sp. AiPa1]